MARDLPYLAGENRLWPVSVNPGSNEEMVMPLEMVFPAAAAGWALLYYLFGGGILGAIVIFVVLKMIGK
jgi:hypothetical protein